MEKELQTTKERAAFETRRLETEASKRRAEADDLQSRLAAQETLNAQLMQQRKTQEAAVLESFDEMEALRTKTERLDEQRNRTIEELDSCEERLAAEKRHKDEALKGLCA